MPRAVLEFSISDLSQVRKESLQNLACSHVHIAGFRSEVSGSVRVTCFTKANTADPDQPMSCIKLVITCTC